MGTGAPWDVINAHELAIMVDEVVPSCDPDETRVENVQKPEALQRASMRWLGASLPYRQYLQRINESVNW